ncbi:MAG: ribbon-helix-helix domain-containing protein [archaeon]
MPAKKTEPTEVLNVRLPAKIISVLDVLVEKGIYNSRSEAVREFLRQHILERRAP